MNTNSDTDTSVRARARAIVEHVYEQRRPRPLIRRRDAEPLAERCLYAGWLDDEVQSAFMAVNSITLIQVEGELRRRAGQSPPPAVSAQPEATGPLPGVPMCPYCANTGRLSRGGALYDCDHRGGFR